MLGIQTSWLFVFLILKPFFFSFFFFGLKIETVLVNDWNRYFGLGPIPKPKPKLANTFDRYHNQYRNHISKEESSYQKYVVFFHHNKETKFLNWNTFTFPKNSKWWGGLEKSWKILIPRSFFLIHWV